jgi:lipopolysaccharide export system protein LptC
VSRLRGFGRAWDRITIYLPVILMGLLALGTYWLARNTPSVPTAVTERAPTHDPDYFLRGFSVKSFDAAGRLKSEVYGVEARHFPDTDTLEIEQPRIRAYNKDGVLTISTARRALSNADGSEVQLLGDALVVREAGAGQPRLEIRGDFLHFFVDRERVRSHRPVRLARGGVRFEGDSLDYDNLERVLELRGNVRGTLPQRGDTAP